MSERILCVDDEPNVLHAYQRTLRKQFAIDIAVGPEEGLAAFARGTLYAVVVADMRMPGMDGVSFLAEVQRRSPATVRMMLTGNADQQTAVAAVNQGHVFRFLNKPCPPEQLAQAISDALAQYRLQAMERTLLSKTLGGAVKMLVEVLSMLRPQAFARAAMVRQLARGICAELAVSDGWAIEMAATLAQIGTIGLPEEILQKVYRGESLTAAENDEYRRHPRIGHELIRNIPRMEEVAEIVGYQEKLYDGRGFPDDYRQGADIPLGSRILKLANDWVLLTSTGLAPEMVMAVVQERRGWYDPEIVSSLKRVLAIEDAHIIKELRVHDLEDGMVLAEDVLSINGTMLCAKGQEINAGVRYRLRNYLVNVGIKGPIKVFIPLQSEQRGVRESGSDGNARDPLYSAIE